MSTVILCQIRQAGQPFYVNDAGVSLYSAEELCWFMENNLPLLDRAFFEEPLQKWLRDELGMERLAGTLETLQKKPGGPLLEELALAVYDEAGWLFAGERGTLLVDENYMTTKPGVFAAGDMITGAKTVVHAVDGAKKAAEAMIRYMEAQS